MKNTKRVVLILIAVVLVAGLWFWCYTTMNAYYDSFDNITEVLYQTGEIVPFGQNKTGDGNVLDGYSIRVDGMELMESEDFAETMGLSLEGTGIEAERIALVYVTLFNEDSDEDVLMLEFTLHGPDNYVGLDWGLLMQLNPELQGTYSIKLAHGQECEIVLPYIVYQRFFGNYTWNNMDVYDWMLRVTYWPEQIDIRVKQNAV